MNKSVRLEAESVVALLSTKKYFKIININNNSFLSLPLSLHKTNMYIFLQRLPGLHSSRQEEQWELENLMDLDPRISLNDQIFPWWFIWFIQAKLMKTVSFGRWIVWVSIRLDAYFQKPSWHVILDILKMSYCFDSNDIETYFLIILFH